MTTTSSCYEVWVISPDAGTNGVTYTRQYLAHKQDGYAARFETIGEAESHLAWWEDEYPMAWANIYHVRHNVGDYIDQSWRYFRKTVRASYH